MLDWTILEGARIEAQDNVLSNAGNKYEDTFQFGRAKDVSSAKAEWEKASREAKELVDSTNANCWLPCPECGVSLSPKIPIYRADSSE
jgi:hypothetical protein